MRNVEIWNHRNRLGLIPLFYLWNNEDEALIKYLIEHGTIKNKKEHSICKNEYEDKENI